MLIKSCLKNVLVLTFVFSSFLLFSHHNFVITDNKIEMNSVDILNTIHLNLSGRSLTTLPENLQEFTNLRIIDLSNNKLLNIDGINEIKAIEAINISGNEFLDHKAVFKELVSMNSLKRIQLNKTGLAYFPRSIFELKQLEWLDLSENEITVFPYEIKKLTKLNYLDLSKNNIKSIKQGLKSLKSLRYLDLSDNNILNQKSLLLQLSVLNLDKLKLDFNFRLDKVQQPINVRTLEITNVSFNENEHLMASFNNLEALSITSNENVIDYQKIIDILSKTTQLNKLTIKDDQLIKLPTNISQLKSLKKIEIEGVNYNGFPISIGKVEKLNEISIIGSDNIEIASLLLRLQQVAHLEVLELKNCNLNTIDKKIARLKSLTALNLSGNKIAELPIEIANMKHLEKCNFNNNPIIIEDLNQIIEKNRKCEFIYSNTQRKIDLVVKPPIKNIDIAYERFNVNASVGSVVYSSAGSNIVIPENAFKDKSGNIVTGNVQLEYREFNDPIDMVFSGIPMSFDKGGEIYNFSSAGMMEFNAYQNNEPLQPNLERKITVNLKSPSASKGYDLFYLSAEEKGWVNIGKDSISDAPVASIDTTVIIDGELADFDLEEPDYPKFPFTKEYINFEVDQVMDSKMYLLKVTPYHFTRGSRYSSRDTTNKKFSELKTLSRTKWRVDFNKNQISRADLDSISDLIKEYTYQVRRRENEVRNSINGAYDVEVGMNLIEDTWLEPNLLKDNFNMCLLIGGDTLKIPVLPKRMHSRPEVLQKQLKKLYSRYKRALNQRKEDWRAIDVRYDEYLANYDGMMSEYQEEKRIYRKKKSEFYTAELTKIGTFSATEDNVFRSFQMTNFGFFNCDIINRMEQPEDLLAEFVDIDFKGVDISTVYILDKDNNGVTTYEGKSDKAFDAAHEISLIAILPNDKIGVISSKNFNKELMKDAASKAILTVFDMKKTSVLDLRLSADFF
jgi:Leucine-rich repeat (LRR) protein